MNIKDWMKRIKDYDKKTKDAEEARNKAYSELFSTQQYRIKVQTSQCNSYQKRLDRFIECEEELDEYIDALYNAKREVMSVIMNVEDLQLRHFLFLRYRLFLPDVKIAEMMSYDVRNIYRLQNRALEAAQKARRKLNL